jgi:hypothetical protein
MFGKGGSNIRNIRFSKYENVECCFVALAIIYCEAEAERATFKLSNCIYSYLFLIYIYNIRFP